jgi:two-component system, NarL family, nitrate/nitrite response regulator NarL
MTKPESRSTLLPTAAADHHVPRPDGKLDHRPDSKPDQPARRPDQYDRPGTGAPIRVIIADSQAIYRVGMSKIFATEPDLDIVSQVEKLADLLTMTLEADVLLLEGSLLAGTTDVLPEVVKLMPNIKIIVQTSMADENHTVELYRRGVRGIIPRAISPELLVRCVRKIAAGETWIDNKSVNWVIEAYRAQAVALTDPKLQPRLSPKELSIISHITQGKRNKEIAFQLGTSEQVIKNYLRKIYEKLGVSDRLELALYCLHHQLDKRAKEMQQKSPA